jgi:hypothetical protein
VATLETKVVYDNLALTIDDQAVYQITAICTEQGELPHIGLFVHRVVDPHDSTQDEFIRVATVADFEELQGTRLDAIADDKNYWRAPDLTVQYTKVDVAEQAVTILGDRVNTLTTDYITYRDSFKAVSAPVLYPTTDPTVVAAAQTAYQTASAAYVVVQTAESAASDAVDDAAVDLATANSDLTAWSAEKNTVCGNISGGGTDLGTKNQTGYAVDAFFDLYDASGPSGLPGNSRDLKNEVSDFLDAYNAITFNPGTSHIRLTLSGGATNAVASDIGQAIAQAVSAATGTLLAFDNASKYWWIRELTGTFDSTNVVSVTAGTGTGAVTAKVDPANAPLDVDEGTLTNQLINFTAIYDDVTAKVADITAAQTDTAAHGSDLDNTVTTKDTAVTTAETELQTNQAAYVTAQGTTQAAYDAVIVAYDTVKSVCPNWVVTPTLPAQP